MNCLTVHFIREGFQYWDINSWNSLSMEDTKNPFLKNYIYQFVLYVQYPNWNYCSGAFKSSKMRQNMNWVTVYQKAQKQNC